MCFAPSRQMQLLAKTDCTQPLSLGDFLVTAAVIYFTPTRADSLEDDLSLPRGSKNWLSKEICDRPMSSSATSSSGLSGNCMWRIPSKPIQSYFLPSSNNGMSSLSFSSGWYPSLWTFIIKCPKGKDDIIKAKTTFWSKDDLKIDLGQTETSYKNFGQFPLFY